MKLYRARPVTVEAHLWDGTRSNADDALAFVPKGALWLRETGDGWVGDLWAGDHWDKVHIGDMIVKDTNVRFSVIPETTFFGRYVAVGE